MKNKEMIATNCNHKDCIFTVVFFFFLLVLAPHAAAQNPSDNQYGYTTNFKPSMVVTIVVLAVACLFIAFFSFSIRRCARDNQVDGGRSMRLNRTRPAPPGLDATVIETFPTFLYSEVKGLKIGKEVLECAVCLNEFEDEETLRLLPKCNHVFHPECIDAWLTSHTTCPVCRANLVPDPSEPLQVQTEDTSAEIPPVVETENPAADITAESPREVSISVVDEGDQITLDTSKPQVIDPTQIAFPVQNRPQRKGSSKRFPRSHSTGHSVVQPGDNHDKFTLKLPEDVRKKILNRTTSLINIPAQGAVCRNGSSVRRNSQSGPLDRGARSERWLTRATSFFWRNNSGRLSKRGEGSVSGKSSLPTTPRPPV